MTGALAQFKVRLAGHVPGWSRLDAAEADAALEKVKGRLCERLEAQEGVSSPWVEATSAKGRYTVGFYLALDGPDAEDPAMFFWHAQDRLYRAAQEAGASPGELM